MFRPVLKRFCHHHSKNILYVPKLPNPLVECESKSITPYVEPPKKCVPVVEETKIFVGNSTLVHSQNKYLPIEVTYFFNNKICKVSIHLYD
jgi:hypothetical protein